MIAEPSFEELSAQLLELSPEMRSRLLDLLGESLDPGGEDPASPDALVIDQEWRKELDRRHLEVMEGRARFVSPEDALAGLRRKYGE